MVPTIVAPKAAPIIPSRTVIAPPGAQREIPLNDIARARPERSPNRSAQMNTQFIAPPKAARAAPTVPPTNRLSVNTKPPPQIPVQPPVVKPPAGFNIPMLIPQNTGPPKIPESKPVAGNPFGVNNNGSAKPVQPVLVPQTGSIRNDFISHMK